MPPTRARLPDFDGRTFSLPDNPESWLKLNAGASGEPLVLGVGPLGAPPDLKGAFRWLEESATLERLRRFADFVEPPENKKISPEQVETLARERPVFFYRPGLRLAPEFWSPLLALAEAVPWNRGATGDLAWLPGDDERLLHRELRRALTARGFARTETKTFAAVDEFARAFANGPPSFVLSVNFRGLDADGRIFRLCRRAGARVAVWLVDNPFHLLSAIKLPWWRDASLFVTDPTFIEPLRNCGARSVRYCPLGYAPHFRRESVAWSPDGAPTFVGRAAFPGRDAFFGRAAPDPALIRLATDLLGRGEPPDYHWWAARVGQKLWPGLAARIPGKGADHFSALRRAAWIRAMGSPRLIGDEGWRALLPNLPLSPPVDYYGSLPDVYASAGYTLNVASLLLPGSLSQRHFDVWAAGGLLVSDNTPGLDLFPRELTEPIRVARPEELPEKWAALRSRPARTRELIEAWREEIFSRHGYGQRIDLLLSP